MKRIFALFLAVCAPVFVTAQEVRITQDMAVRDIEIDGKLVTFERIQDRNSTLTGEFAKTSRPCPPFCIHPMSVAQGVETIGELEVMDFLDGPVRKGEGLLIDSRVPEWYVKGSIPGSINVPFSTLEPTNPYRDEILGALGAKKIGSGWDFSGAYQLALFCNGPWCDQGPRAIRDLLSVGYPAEKIKYYRGGMQVWLVLGLNTVSP